MAKITTINKNSTLEKLIFVGLCILTFFPPFFRGLFFEKELLPTHIFSFALGIIWITVNLKNKSYKLIKTPTDFLALGVVSMYIVSIFYAVNTRLAILEAFKYMNYFLIYVFARDVVNDKNRNTVFNVLIASAFIVSIIGIGSAIGTLNYNGAFVSNRVNSTFQYPNTLASYLGVVFIITISMILREKNRKLKSGYSFLSSIILLTLILTYSRGMWLIFPFCVLIYLIILPNDRKLETFIYIIINAIVAIPLAFLFAKYLELEPNMCWLIVSCVGLLTAIFTYVISNVEGKLRAFSIKRIIVGLTILLVGTTVCIILAINSTTSVTLENTTNQDKWSTIIRETGEIEPNKGYKISINYNGKIEEENQYAGRITIQSMSEDGHATKIKDIELKNVDINEVDEEFSTIENTESLKILVQNYYEGTSITFNQVKILDRDDNLIKNIPLKYKYIPEDIVVRTNSISLKENSAQGRLTFYNDSIKVIKDYFVLGTGGGGWISLYKMYQAYGYESTQAHNYYLQLFIEVGIIGLLLFIAFIILVSFKIYSVYKQSSDNEKIFIASVYISIVSILTHAFMDFDLSLCALTFILWLLLGLLSSLIKGKNKVTKTDRYIKWIILVILIILMLVSSAFVVGSNYGDKAVKSYKEGNNDATIKYFESASKLDPYNPRYKMDLANIYKLKFKENKDKELILESIELMEEAFELAKYDSKNLHTFISNISTFFFNVGDVEKGIEYIDEIAHRNPINSMSHLIKSKAYLQAIEYYLNEKKDIDKAKKYIESAFKIKDEINQINDVALKPLKYNEELINNLGFIQFYKENIEKNEYSIDKDDVLKFAYYFDLDIDNNEKIDKLRTWNSEDGNISYEFESEESSYIRVKNSGQKSGVIYLDGLKLEPDTNYKICFKARGTVLDKTFKFYLRDNKSKTKIQGGLGNIEINNKWSIFSCEIKTTSDINTESPFLGFFHYGKDRGYVDIKEVLIFEEK